MKQTFECNFNGLSRYISDDMKPYWRANVELTKDYAYGRMKTNRLVTSRISSIDFDQGIITTVNSIYVFDASKLATKS